MKATKVLTAVLAAGLGLGSVGCATNAGNGALIGGAGGALAGAAIGSHSHSRAGAGALIGGAVGALGGAIVGNEIDRLQHERAYDDHVRYDERRYDDGYYSEPPVVYRPAYRSVVRYDVRYYDCRPVRYGYRSYGRGAPCYGPTYYGYR